MFAVRFSLRFIFFFIVFVIVNLNHTAVVTCEQAEDIEDATWRSDYSFNAMFIPTEINCHVTLNVTTVALSL